MSEHEKLISILMELEPFSALFCIDPNYMTCDHCESQSHTENCPVTRLRESLIKQGEE